jgi:aspartate carbamoyltransferase catalytic subunit
MLGDLKHGRTVHSLALLAARLTRPPRLAFVAPPSLAMPTDVTTSLTAAGVQVEQRRKHKPIPNPSRVRHPHPDQVEQADSLEGVLPKTDVLYVTRVQKERFASEKEYEVRST